MSLLCLGLVAALVILFAERGRAEHGVGERVGKVPLRPVHVGVDARRRAGRRMHHQIVALDDPDHRRGIACHVHHERTAH